MYNARSRPCASFKSPDSENSMRNPDLISKPRKQRLRKANSSAMTPSSGCSNPVTPENKIMKRSTSSTYRGKPATPYAVTPQVGSKRSKHAAAFVASRTPLLL